jgi:hypothetical protein
METFFAIVIFSIAIFFASTWSLVVWRNPVMRYVPFCVVIVYWWIEIILAYADQFSFFHLVWLMPLTVVPPWVLHSMLWNKTFLRNFITSGVIIAPIIILLVLYS